MQIAPYVERVGKERIFLTSLERLERQTDTEFARIGAFLQAPAPFVWRHDMPAANVSSERVRAFPFKELLIESRAATFLRQNFVPQALRDWVKDQLRMKRRPALTQAMKMSLAEIFDADRAALLSVFPEFDPLWP